MPQNRTIRNQTERYNATVEHFTTLVTNITNVFNTTDSGDTTVNNNLIMTGGDIQNVENITSNTITLGATATAYTLPAARGNNNQIMSTDGAGVVSWVNNAGGGGGGNALTFTGTFDGTDASVTGGAGTLTNGSGALGEYYRVSVAGTITLDGTSVWAIDDWVWNDGTIWRRAINSTPTLTSDDIDNSTTTFIGFGPHAITSRLNIMDYAGAGPITANLPASPTEGDIISIVTHDSSVNCNSTGGLFIESSPTTQISLLNQYDKITFIYGNSIWNIV
jgi:hypothetical protein